MCVGRRYALRETLGSGGYGVVCSAQDLVSGQSVAMKRVQNVFTKAIEGKRLLRELKLLQFCKHENVCVVLCCVVSCCVVVDCGNCVWRWR